MVPATVSVEAFEGEGFLDKIFRYSQICCEKGQNVVFDRNLLTASNREVLEDTAMWGQDVCM